MDLEWPTLTRVKYKEKYSYGVYNDYENVYFLFKTFNPRLVELIFERGMTLWINGNGGKLKEIGITYLPPPKYRIYNEESNRTGRMPETERVGTLKRILKKDALFELIDLAEGDMTAALGKQVNSEYIIYEAQFSFISIRQYALEKNIDKGKLSFTIEFGPMAIRNNDFSGNTRIIFNWYGEIRWFTRNDSISK